MTPERQVVLDTALTSTKDPDKLRTLAKVFRDQGLDAQATLLELRAKLRELPPDVQEGRKDAFRAGMASTNANGVRALADTFEREGATGAAAALRLHAFELDHPAGQGIQDSGLQSATQFNPAPGPASDAIQAATAMLQQQQANPDQAVANAAATAIAIQNQLADEAVRAGDHPESDALSQLLSNPIGDGSQ
jgi:hypothetical protein